MTRHLDGRACLRSHACPQRRGEVLCPLISAGLLPGGTERRHSGKGALLPRPSDGFSSREEGDGFSLDSTSHPSPASPPWSQAPQAPHPHSSTACCVTLENPFPSLCPVSPLGKMVTVTALDQRVRGSPEPPRVCCEPSSVPTPGRSQRSRAKRTETTGDRGQGLGHHLTRGD